MNRSVYSKIPLLLLAFLAGVALRSFFDIPEKIAVFVVGIVGGLLLIAEVTKKISRCGRAPAEYDSDFSAGRVKEIFFATYAIILLSFLFGILRFSVFQNNIVYDQLHRHYVNELVLRGTVLSSTNKENSSRVVLKTALGKILVVKRIYPEYKYGDELEIKGIVSEPKPYNDFDVKKYLAKDQIYSEMIFPEMQKIGYEPQNKILSVLFHFKEKFEDNLEKILPQPHAALAQGMLLGKESAIDQNLLEAFRKTGTIHILVLSGYNITIVAIFLMAILGFLPEVLAWIGAIFGIMLFTLMTGAEPAAVRASIMAIIGLFALKAGRLKSASSLLLWAAFIMILWNPMYLRFDRGFQLSFLATLGLILMASRFEKILLFLPKFLSIRESTSASLSAQIFVIPLLLSWGNFVSPWSPLVNVLVVGAVPPIMFFGFLGGLTAFLSGSLGLAIASVSYVLISYQIYIVNFFANL